MALMTGTGIFDIQEKLQPYIKPREQVNYIRRILALELGSRTGNEPLQQPLALVESSLQIDPGNLLEGAHRLYVEALRSNAIAHREFEVAARGHDGSLKQDSGARGANRSARPLLEGHAAILRLKKTRDGIRSIHECTKQLAASPTAIEGSSDLREILKGSKMRPAVPSEVVNSLVAEQDPADVDLQASIALLERTLLKARLQLRQQRQLLTETKLRFQTNTESAGKVSNVHALNKVRSELIRWIETELSKASRGEVEQAEGKGGGGSQHEINQPALQSRGSIAPLLDKIQEKYSAYISSRKALLVLLSHAPRLSLLPPKANKQRGTSAAAEEPCEAAHLLTPYLEAIMSQSSLQKALITHKSHIFALLGNKCNETNQVLSRLADESQLLPAYPIKLSPRRTTPAASLSREPTEQSPIVRRIEPWISAADAAKIGTLETVAERVETGQVALEGGMNAIHDSEVLLGAEEVNEGAIDQTSDAADADIWLHDVSDDGHDREKHLSRKSRASSQLKFDPWARIHGNLGLIGHDDP